MASRPIFLAREDSVGAVERLVEFDWHPGMAITQKQKSIRSLHQAASAIGVSPLLEISSKSEIEAGVKLSAFNLLIRTKTTRRSFTLETAFQGSKVFERGGPFRDLLGLDSRAAKKDIRLTESGNLIGFEFFGRHFPLTPRTFFYDWLYVNALVQNIELAREATIYKGFTDIEFNPSKSLNCQARSAAIFVSLIANNCLDLALESPESFLNVTKNYYNNRATGDYVQGKIV